MHALWENSSWLKKIGKKKEIDVGDKCELEGFNFFNTLSTSSLRASFLTR